MASAAVVVDQGTRNFQHLGYEKKKKIKHAGQTERIREEKQSFGDSDDIAVGN